jgi:gamma-glutamyltranspeptidase/glutathione hydrolase
LFYDAKAKTVTGLNGSGRSPKKLTVDYVRERGITGNVIPVTDLNSVTVPGCAAAWVDTIEKLGSGKLSVADVLAPAIRLADEGVPVSELHARSWLRSENLIKNASPNADEMLLNGKAPLAGQIKTFPTLAQTFREVAEKGKDGFYKGRVAEEVKLIHYIPSQPNHYFP